MNFRVGQKVVCVNDRMADNARIWDPQTVCVISGRVYEVREVGLDVSGAPGIRVFGAELTGDHGAVTHKSFRDAFWNASRFRPIIERKTDISIFQEIARSVTKQKENVCGND